jgi:hypothetical protein
MEPHVTPYPAASPFHNIDGGDFASMEDLANQLYGWLLSQSIVNENCARERMKEAEDANGQARIHIARASKLKALAESIKSLPKDIA